MKWFEKLETNKEVEEYFKSLGYEYSFDFQRATGIEWHEIICPKSKKMICQIDMNVPLRVIREDFLAFKNGASEGTSDCDYTVGWVDDILMNSLFKSMNL